MFELILLGIGVGTLSGLFGIGGGTILIPILLFLEFDTKVVIGISVVQMVFSSIYGSYLNVKKGTLDLSLITVIGFGGFVGAQLSSVITLNVSDKVLEILLLSFVTFAFLKLFITIKEQKREKLVSKKLLFSVGFIIGIFSISIGVGGSMLLVPILVGLLHMPLKKATSAGLFFVVFSSVSGLISYSLNGNIDYENGVIIGGASLLGVYFGIHLKDKISMFLQKQMMVVFYLMVVIYLTYRILVN